jgi:hypothetical protein
MNIRFAHLLAFGMAAWFALPALAGDDDRNVSIYDQHPECLDRSDPASNSPACVMPDSQIPDQKIITHPDSEEPTEPSGSAPG